jgi:hypothetical protein
VTACTLCDLPTPDPPVGVAMASGTELAADADAAVVTGGDLSAVPRLFDLAGGPGPASARTSGGRSATTRWPSRWPRPGR